MLVMLLMLLMLLTMEPWNGVKSQSTSVDSCCSDNVDVDSPSVFQSLSVLARCQLTAVRNLDVLSRDLKHVRIDLQRLRKLSATQTNS